jgi:HlyD family type I secretion membrane fusion protein
MSNPLHPLSLHSHYRRLLGDATKLLKRFLSPVIKFRARAYALLTAQYPESDRLMPANDNADMADDVGPAYRAPIIVGFAVVTGFFAVFGAWAVLAPLKSAVIASGLVKVDGQRKTIQHLEGGIVSEILVREGDRVAAGQVLVRLDNTQSRASLKLLHGGHMAAKALEARLIARRDGLTEIDFPDALKKADPNEVDPIMAGQVNIFQARNSSLKSEKEILGQRIAQLGEEISGLRGQIKAEDRQIELITEELKGLKKLFEKGLAKRDRMLALQRNAAAIEGNRSMHIADVARAKQKITETQLLIDGLGTKLMKDVVEELRKTQEKIFEVSQRMVALKDTLTRTDIKAPLSGTVMALKVHSARGVIAPGAPLLDIVPDGGRLVVEVQVQPVDIDIVSVNLPAEIRLTAFDTVDSIPVDGVVRFVSADRLIDEQSGADYFLARVEITGDLDKALGSAALSPGMQAEVMIQTGERTPLNYLLAPITKSLARAMREQ